MNSILSSRMKPLDLEFHRRRPPSLIGWALFVLALLFIVDLGRSYHAAREAVAGSESGLAQQARARGSARPAASRLTATPEEMALARETVQRLRMPWDALFGALEAAASDEVALTGIEPDAKTGTVLVTGEAASYPATLDYVVRLRQGKALGSAHLVKHELRNGTRPVAFTVSASWGEVQP
jgi:hypothetical protein